MDDDSLPGAARDRSWLSAPARPSRAAWTNAVLAGAGGGLLALSLPPRGWWPAGLIGIVLIGGALQHQTATRRVWLGALAGVSLFGPGLWWVTDLHLGGYLTLVAVQTVWFASMGLLVAPRRVWMTLPMALVLVEAGRWRIPLGGLPFASPVLGQVDGPWAGYATWAGPLAVVMAMAIAGSLTVVVMLPSTLQRRLSAAAALTALVLAPALQPDPTAARTSLDVAVVQGGGPRGLSAVTTGPTAPLRRHLQASESVPDDIDLVVWPEDVIDVDGPFDRSSEAAAVRALATDLATTLVVGVTEEVRGGPQGGRRFRNAALALNDDGVLVDRYDKVLRVPFGEYVPLRGLLGRLVDLTRVPRDAVAGTGRGLLQTPAGPLGTAISFEGMFPRRATAAVRAGGEVLLIPTNAASYRGDAVPAQQLAAARLRARETARWVVQAAPTGYSAIIDPDGRVVVRSALGAAQVLVETVGMRRDVTPYVRLGDGPVIALAVAVVGLAWCTGQLTKDVNDTVVVASRHDEARSA